MLSNVGWWARNLRSVGHLPCRNDWGLLNVRFLYKSAVFWFDGWAGLAGGCGFSAGWAWAGLGLGWAWAGLGLGWLGWAAGWAGLVARLLLVAICKGKVNIACRGDERGC